MSHVHDSPTIIREEVGSSDSGTGMGMVLGVILVVVLAIGMFWLVAGARIFGTTNSNTNQNQQPPSINIAPPKIDIEKPNIEINPPAPAPQNPAPANP
jgi:hypothetical protein